MGDADLLGGEQQLDDAGSMGRYMDRPQSIQLMKLLGHRRLALKHTPNRRTITRRIKSIILPPSVPAKSVAATGKVKTQKC